MFIKTTSDILAEQNLAFDNKNKVRVPNEYFLTKIRNAVAHGHYMYDKEKDSFYYRGTAPQFLYLQEGRQ